MKTRLFALASVAAVLPMGAHAATITFSAPQTISGDSDVINVGPAVDAFTFGTNNPTTVNGVTFTPGPNNGATDTFTSAYGGYGSGAAPFSSLSGAYQALLTGGLYEDGPNNSITLNNLTPGQTYELQTWVNDSRGCCGGTRSEQFGDGTAGPLSAAARYNTAGGVEGSVGQFETGTFTADATSQIITYNSPNSQVNGLLVEVAVPEPSTWIAAGGLLLLAAGDFRRRLKA